MFTGLIETVGTVVEISARQGSRRLGIASALPIADLREGESISVDGVCLTVAALRNDRFWADAVRETLDLTTLGQLRTGARVNLERALCLGDRVGGHLVQGHVDAMIRVAAVRHSGDDHRLRLAIPSELAGFVAVKGSVAVHGVSLTVSAVTRDGFEVALIPETLKRTNLGELKVGSKVNLEVDLLARYLDRLLRKANA